MPPSVKGKENVFSRLATLRGGPVRDLRWRAASPEIHLEEGILYPDPPIEGAQVDAFFQGRGTFTFQPGARKSQDDLKDFLGATSLEAEAITKAYFFSLRGKPLLEQLGVTASPDHALEDVGVYTHAKNAFRMAGTRLLVGDTG